MSPADRLEYLDLHGQTKHYFEIRLTTEFIFKKCPGMFCWFPTTKTTVLSSEPIKCEIVRIMLEKIHTDFSCSIVHQVCYNLFNWNTVELPPKMLQSAIDNAKEAYAQEAVDIVQTHGRSLKWTHRECGDRIKLTQFIAENKDELLEAYSHLTFPENSGAKSHVAQANPKAKHHDINATFTMMDHEWMALCAQTGTEGFYVAVCGSIKDLSEPKVFFKLEAFVISGLDENTIITCQCPLNKLISDCHTIIQEELVIESIALEKNIKKAVQMNYINYKRNIVEHCSVALVGWHQEKVRLQGSTI
ncbi:hypothetical protein F4604DRAFT_1689895 [Suillus subluteus]|nr:hypothetical protein F4604DRAFT_1689895 [Suillus subluteus]